MSFGCLKGLRRAKNAYYGCRRAKKTFWFCVLFIIKLKDSAFKAVKRDVKL